MNNNKITINFLSCIAIITIINSLNIFQSSLDRGCFGCECSFLLNNEDGLRFWRQKLGAKKVNAFLPPHHPHHNLSNDSNSSLLPASHAFEDKEEIVIEISRDEMKAYHDEARQDCSPL